MSPDSVNLLELTPERARAHYERLVATADAPSMIETAARRIGKIPSRALPSDKDIVDVLLFTADVQPGSKEWKKFRRKAKKALAAGHERLSYTVVSEAELVREAAVDAAAYNYGVKKEGEQRWRSSQNAEAAAEPYVNVASLGDDVTPPAASAGMVRDDGVFTLVAREWNAHNGHPGAFKSGLAALHAYETLKRGGRVQWYDVDGNTPQAVVSRLLSAGVKRGVLNNPDRFRLTISASSETLLSTVSEAADWLEPDDLVVMDAAGGLVAAFGGDSNSADDWMRLYQSMLAPLVATGAAGLLVDHYAKTAAGTGYATGTGAKLKSLHGIVYSIESWKNEPPRPDSVGKVSLKLVKDTHGATGYGVGDLVAVLELDSRDSANGPWSWRLMPGRSDEEREDEQAEVDVAYVLGLDPFPTSRPKLQAAIRAAQGTGWSNVRANTALTAARERRSTAAVTFDPTTHERTKKD